MEFRQICRFEGGFWRIIFAFRPLLLCHDILSVNMCVSVSTHWGFLSTTSLASGESVGDLFHVPEVQEDVFCFYSTKMHIKSSSIILLIDSTSSSIRRFVCMFVINLHHHYRHHHHLPFSSLPRLWKTSRTMVDDDDDFDCESLLTEKGDMWVGVRQDLIPHNEELRTWFVRISHRFISIFPHSHPRSPYLKHYTHVWYACLVLTSERVKLFMKSVLSVCCVCPVIERHEKINQLTLPQFFPSL